MPRDTQEVLCMFVNENVGTKKNPRDGEKVAKR